jgi:PKD repeat protein
LGTSEPLENYYEYRFHGIIDEARIYQRALSHTEVNTLVSWFPTNVEAVSSSFIASPTSGFAPLASEFTNTSTGSFTSSLWSFGDNITSTLQSPTHTFVSGGVYSVSLNVSGPGGDAESIQASAVQVEWTPDILPTVDNGSLSLTWYNELESTEYEVWLSEEPYFTPGAAGAILLATIDGVAGGGVLSHAVSIDSTNQFYMIRAVQGAAEAVSNTAAVFRYDLVSGAASLVEADSFTAERELIGWERRPR